MLLRSKPSFDLKERTDSALPDQIVEADISHF